MKMNKNELPRNLRNNNPLNMRRTRDQWLGLREEQTDRSFCQFKEMKYGWRAAFIQLCRNYYYRDKLKTIDQIIGKWAPAVENDTKRYAATVRHWMGVQPDYVLPYPAYDSGTWMKLALCMACYDGGVKFEECREHIDYLPLIEGWMMYEDVAHKGRYGAL